MVREWWLKARSVLAPRKQPQPEPYTIQCVCGHVLRGWRTSAVQRVLCPECGAPRCVLPKSPYPRVMVPASHESRAPTTQPSTERLPRSQSRLEATAAAEKVQRLGQEKSVGECEATAFPSATMSPASQGKKEIPRTGLSPSTRGLRRSWYLTWGGMVVGILLMMGGTAWLSWRHAQYEWAKLEIRPAYERGCRAFLEQRWSEALTEFDHALRAAQLLRRYDRWVKDLQQWRQEAQVAYELKSETIEELLEQAPLLDRNFVNPRSSPQTDHVWLLLDAPLFVEDSGEEGLRAQVLLPLSWRGRVWDVLVQRLGWPKEPLLKMAQPVRCLFAARLLGIMMPADASEGGMIVLAGEDAVLWGHHESWSTLSSLGDAHESDRESLSELLARQREWLNLQEPLASRVSSEPNGIPR
ncbi:MAG: hypothetical protein KatS3mg113_0970 [Planctomycetaceae bacterium]|nr:MAG: hypothetical protein KatS3mg113_0970 [Planctomycetaceae bacterium]